MLKNLCQMKFSGGNSMTSDELQVYLEKSPNMKLRDTVAEMLYDEIVSLRIAPGSKLNVNSIASSLGISRTPVAEAIISLYERGFVTTKADANGYYVIDLSMRDMIDLYDLRASLECEAAALCAMHASEETILELERLALTFKEYVLAGDTAGMIATDLPFHMLIVQSCGNVYVKKCYELLLPNLTMYQSSMMSIISSASDNPWSTNVIYNHLAVVEAVKMHIPELARQAMSEHITSSLNYTMYSGGNADPFSYVRNRGKK